MAIKPAEFRSLAIERRIAAESKSRKAAPENKDLGAPSADKASMSMTKAELQKLAKSEGVEVETDDNKDDLVRKINAKG